MDVRGKLEFTKALHVSKWLQYASGFYTCQGCGGFRGF
ncbi:hypothetical protein DAD186_01060 [Dermabacter vaginalis]|uniref:Uncharacterized protein n=1 Tax=Dermabacter vaginalis TaxID=1630135 RepID=A0A1B0ZFF4_9MICO|nr:hypothetical protein DAD186_01060 [Dermabacter vaginalis]